MYHCNRIKIEMFNRRRKCRTNNVRLFCKSLLGFLLVAFLIVLCCACTNAPSFQSETTVLGLELETMGSITGGETPVPKLRFGLIRHKGQIVQQSQAAYMYSEAEDINLWSASGSCSTEMIVKPKDP